MQDKKNADTTTHSSMFYTLSEMAQLMRMSYNGVYHMVRTGKIPAVKFGRIYRIKAGDAQRVLNEGVSS